jgi:thiamine-phosphate pyrophosphorylase
MIRYAITNGSPRPGCLTSQARGWVEAGIDFVQLRDKSLQAGALAALARALLDEFGQDGGPPRLLINGRADVAAAVGAAGVHLTAHPGELTPEQVRRVFTLAGRPAPVVSVSCHTLDEVQRAHRAEVDLILFGPVFEKRVEGEVVAPGAGLAGLQAACKVAPGSPVLALGGITVANTPACLAAGAAGIAGIRLFA